MAALAWPGWSQPLWLWLAGVGAAAKWLGLAGCAALLLLGLAPAKKG
jgi:hypothetical protein